MVPDSITLQGIILAFCGFIGIQSYKMNGCIKRIEGKLEKKFGSD